MIKRRDLLRTLGTIPVLGAAAPLAAGPSKSQVATRDYFKELGVRSYINAAGTYTALTASLMPQEARDAWNYASNQYVALDDLQDRVGARIAELLQCEAATVTAGAASAITLGTAGVLTGLDSKKAVQIPNDMTGLKTEVILQKSHRVGYDHAIRNTGVSIVEVESRQDLENAISDKTAMLWFLNAHNFKGQIRDEEFVRIAKRHGIPCMNDCAADVPPVENLWKYTKMGFDLVCFSGGKGIRGPQSAGLLLGKKEYIEAARLSAPPRGNTVGRGMKVNKEEILCMLVALEVYLSRDHDADWKLWEYQVDHISDAAASVAGVETEIHVPDVANHVPSLRIRWNSDSLGITPNEARQRLREGHPSIETVGGAESLDVTTWMMNEGEERIVAQRIKEVLTQS
ncbi:MAG: aminotransferase class V-fold PLP-dependent enzyme [Saprospiraceae bacterium]|nr:aminotransferase class V-fold PLP-dependent enzyme [Saprospiraceae bacterium]